MNIDLPVQKILGEALKEGGEFADLFFEQNDSVLIICEADRIEKVISGQDIGVGLRVLFNGRTIYGFTNQVAEEDLLRLAGRLNKAVKEDGGGRTMDLSHHFQSPSSSLQMSNPLLAIQKHPEGVSIKEKVSVVRQANDTARKLDPHVQQVRILYRDVSQVLSIANSEGVLSKGERVGTVF